MMLKDQAPLKETSVVHYLESIHIPGVLQRVLSCILKYRRFTCLCFSTHSQMSSILQVRRIFVLSRNIFL